MVTEGEDIPDVPPDGTPRVDPGQPGGGPVDREDAARTVGHDDTVGKIIDLDRAHGIRVRLIGVLSLHDPASSTYKADNSGFPR
ncbi:hypothetical protein Misp01_14780 [Microtetraspora sp. NBRC 13810]|nr:hypothetical protein Misp01_14780 [Microtetraspora sp. NBRC 13810]